MRSINIAKWLFFAGVTQLVGFLLITYILSTVWSVIPSPAAVAFIFVCIAQMVEILTLYSVQLSLSWE